MRFKVNKVEPNGSVIVSESGNFKITSGVYQPNGYDPGGKYNLWCYEAGAVGYRAWVLYGVTNSKADAVGWMKRMEEK